MKGERFSKHQPIDDNQDDCKHCSVQSMYILLAVRVDNCVEEAAVLQGVKNKGGEWVDGTAIDRFTPSADGKTFKGFPYFILTDDDGDITWADDLLT